MKYTVKKSIVTKLISRLNIENIEAKDLKNVDFMYKIFSTWVAKEQLPEIWIEEIHKAFYTNCSLYGTHKIVISDTYIALFILKETQYTIIPDLEK